MASQLNTFHLCYHHHPRHSPSFIFYIALMKLPFNVFYSSLLLPRPELCIFCSISALWLLLLRSSIQFYMVCLNCLCSLRDVYPGCSYIATQIWLSWCPGLFSVYCQYALLFFLIMVHAQFWHMPLIHSKAMVAHATQVSIWLCAVQIQIARKCSSLIFSNFTVRMVLVPSLWPVFLLWHFFSGSSTFTHR